MFNKDNGHTPVADTFDMFVEFEGFVWVHPSSRLIEQ